MTRRKKGSSLNKANDITHFNENDRKRLNKIYENEIKLVEQVQELRTELDAHKKELNAVKKENPY